MSKTGRPKLGDAAKGGTIRLRVNAAENEQLQAAADKKGLPLSTWARELLLAAARKGK